MPASHANCDLPQEHERENVEGIECHEGCAQLESIHNSHTTLCSERKNVFAAFLFSLKSVKKTPPLCEEHQKPVLYSLHRAFFLKYLTSVVFALIILFLRFLENNKRKPIFFPQYKLSDFFFSLLFAKTLCDSDCLLPLFRFIFTFCRCCFQPCTATPFDAGQEGKRQEGSCGEE